MGDVGAVSHRGRVREDNEDRYVARTTRAGTLIAVADGVGGEAGGELASAAAVNALASAFDGRARDIAGALATAVRGTNDAVLRTTGASPSPSAASTLVAAAVRGRQLAVANLGDSRAYLVRRGVARQITTDHRGEVANSITRFVGDPRGVAPDVFVEALRARDRVVLCSDGLTRHVEPSEIAALSAGPPERAARALVDLANARGGQDNVTVVVYAAPASGARAIWVMLVALVAIAVTALVTSTPVLAPGSPAPPTATPDASPTPTTSP